MEEQYGTLARNEELGLLKQRRMGSPTKRIDTRNLAFRRSVRRSLKKKKSEKAKEEIDREMIIEIKNMVAFLRERGVTI